MNCTKCRKKFQADEVLYPHQCGHTFTQASMKAVDVREKVEFFRSKLMRRILERDGRALIDLDNELLRQEK